MKIKTLLSAIVIFTLPVVTFADNDHDENDNAAPNAQVDFGVLPTGPLGPPPCLQTGAIGGPADPCSYKIHHLTPEEVTIRKGGQITFQIHGGGHGIAIYSVSKNTTRDGLGQFLCAGADPKQAPDPSSLICNLSANNANAPHNVVDGKGNVVYVVQANVTNAHPDNRVWSEPGRLMSAGAQQFLNGGTIPAGATSNGQLVSYRFMKTGRYVVICMNRVHHLNDWMFGFVNVAED
jgi:hypothetical protein